MATSSSTTNTHHLLHGTTSAPPPTPSTQPNISPDTAADTLSRLLHRLPPSLSLPTRLSPRATTIKPTTNTATTPTATSLTPLPTSSFQLGYFQLTPTHHSITPQLAESAELESLSLFNLPLDEKHDLFPKEWPLGFDNNDDEDEQASSFCLDGACSTITKHESTDLNLSSLRELTRELKKLGQATLESLARAIGFENKLVGSTSMMWISEGEGRVYPYVVGLQYQIRAKKWSLLLDSGLVILEPQVGSVLVTIGDIAQVWSNGKLKKVRGRPVPISDDQKSNSPYISMTLLLTLPLESTVSPLLTIHTIVSNKIESSNDELEKDETYNDKKSLKASTNDEGYELDEKCEEIVFNSFSFEDYAWRVYHERLPLKDPLIRYRVVD